MKILNKRDLQQVAFNHSSDNDFTDLMNLYKKCIDATLASYNLSCFRKNLLERIQKLIMTIYDKIRDGKLQYDVNRETAKISGLSSGKLDKYEYLTGEEILPSDKRRVIEEAKFTYSILGKSLEKQTKAIEYQEKKQTN